MQRKTVLTPPAEGGRPVRRATLSPEVDMPAPVEVAAPADATTATLEGDPLVDNVLAAEHMRQAGEIDAAAEQLCEAARKAAAGARRQRGRPRLKTGG